jgi:hypothetical protein
MNTGFVKLAAREGSSSVYPVPLKLSAYDVHPIKSPRILHVRLNIKPAEAKPSINRRFVNLLVSYLLVPVFIPLYINFPLNIRFFPSSSSSSYISFFLPPIVFRFDAI